MSIVGVVAGLSTGAASAAAPPEAPPPVANAWEHEAGPGGVQFAFFSGPEQELTIRCKGGAVEVVYYVDDATLDPALLGRLSAVLAVVIDDTDDLRWVDTRLVAERGVVSIGIGGAPADEMARSIAGASKSVAVSILTEAPKTETVPRNRSRFPVTGAADAIRAAYSGCGIRY